MLRADSVLNRLDPVVVQADLRYCVEDVSGEAWPCTARAQRQATRLPRCGLADRRRFSADSQYARNYLFSLRFV